MGGYRSRSEPIPFVPPSFMIGSIVIWSGSIATIPSNWQLCDGTNGTPDLRNRFVRGAQNQAAIDNTGGQDSQSHNFTSNIHAHVLLGAPPNTIQSGSGLDSITTSVAVTGTTDAEENRPAFYELAYIQRIS